MRVRPRQWACDWVSEMQTSPRVSWSHRRPYLARLASGDTLDQLRPYTKKGCSAGVRTRTWYYKGEVRTIKYNIFIIYTSKWSFPTLKVKVTLALSSVEFSSCSMLSKVEWSRKTSGFCFAELTKSSVSKGFWKQRLYLLKSLNWTMH